jgi:uncharacterized membrane protein HdeD (DUF308 family)
MLTMLAARNWWLFLVRGLAALLFGILAFLQPGITLASLILVFGAYALVEGVFAIGAGFGAPSGVRWWIILGGLAAITIGLLTLISPEATAIAVVTFIGALAVARGVAEVITAFTMRKTIEGEWLYILSGIVSILFGLYVIVFPGAGALALLWLIGFYALFAGVMSLAMGWRLRGIAKGEPGGMMGTGAA